ncbi:hypothetical protein OC709_00690 ['Planchonia careya' phytoplasma]|nr:hypothetical protein ['Planchonia careya' phytoplasma]MDO8030038.1 hypothetical protein ['Planchonia careya' phytoplasma]
MNKKNIKKKKIFLLSILIASILFFIIFIFMGNILFAIGQQHDEICLNVSSSLENNLESGQKDLILNITNYAEKSVNDITDHIKNKLDQISIKFDKSVDDLKENVQLKLYKSIDHLEQHTKEHSSKIFYQVLEPEISKNLTSLKSNILNIFSDWLYDTLKLDRIWQPIKKTLLSFFSYQSDDSIHNNYNSNIKIEEIEEEIKKEIEIE